MGKTDNGSQASLINVKCPYCNAGTSINEPGDYAPYYIYCRNCGQKFIIERLAKGIDIIKTEDAPCCSDPDCREIEMSSGDEE
jgi:hypothetical protein